jgi:DNA end-binding protein Ku
MAVAGSAANSSAPTPAREYEYAETTRGFEIAPDQYVIVTTEELDSLKPEAARTIDITDFVDLASIDPIFYNRPYYLAPDERGGKAYRLLHEAMTRSQKVGIATFVMRQKQYLAALRPMQGALCLEVMNYADEIVPLEEIPGAEAAGEVDKRELTVAQRLIDALSGDFEPDKYKDEYREQLEQLIEKKAAGEEVVLQPAREEPERIADLMQALEASLANVGRDAGKRSSRRAKSEEEANPPRRRGGARRGRRGRRAHRGSRRRRRRPSPARGRSEQVHRTLDRDRRAEAAPDEPGEGAVPGEQVHQGDGDRLLRADRAGHDPALKNRPVTLKRYPGGAHTQPFYEKNCPSHKPEWVPTAKMQTSRKEINLCLINDVAALVWIANLASLEVHTYLARSKNLERPDFARVRPGSWAAGRGDCERADCDAVAGPAEGDGAGDVPEGVGREGGACVCAA